MQRLGRVIGNLLAVMLAVFSLQAMAEPQLAGRDFNHAATGFPLTGGHATAACETCHVAGVFKGTAKTCDGCHALGKRVVATPKSTSHIVTDAPCDTCHFNASTFLGARFNHGTALPGQCANCHNGRQSMGKPASHSSGNKATKSCDQCHRSFTWFQASWNHVGVVPGSCATPGNGCHVQGENQYFRSATTHSRTGMATYNCDDCHNFVTWVPALYKHNRGGTCSSCHNGSIAVGTPAGHVDITATPECSQCHTSTATWLGALGGMPSNHIPFNAGVTCNQCHTSPAPALVNMTILHTYSIGSHTCAECHISPTPYSGNNQKTKSSHSGSSGNNCSNCHKSAASYSGWGT